MGVFAAIPVIGAILDKGLGIIDKCVEDKDLKTQLKAQFESQLLQLDFSIISKQIEAQAQIIAAETQGRSWLQRNWRPILMLVVVAIVANNYLLFPYLRLLFPGYVHMLDLPERLWDLMTLGVGGYIAGRSVEKGIEAWKRG